VIHDFIAKLTNDSEHLEILGDGTQRKSYLYVDDCIDSMFTALHHTIDPVSVLNVSSEDQISVVDIAQIVVEELDLDDVAFTFTGGVNGGRGWRGDVKNMLLDVRRLKSLGWHWKHTSEAAVRRTVQTLSSLEKLHP
jgi:UDP-glucose 4-epimerase